MLIFGESRKTLVEINLSLKFLYLRTCFKYKNAESKPNKTKHNTLLAKENRSICQICSSI